MIHRKFNYLGKIRTVMLGDKSGYDKNKYYKGFYNI